MGNNDCGDGFTPALWAKAVVCLALHVDSVRFATQALRDVPAHLFGHRRDPRFDAKDGAVKVDKTRVVRVEHRQKPDEKVDTPCVLILHIVLGKVVAQRASPERARQSVDNRVGNNVTVGLRIKSLPEIRELHAPEYGRVPVE